MNKKYNSIRKQAVTILIIGSIILAYLIFLYIQYVRGGPTMREAALMGVSFLITKVIIFLIIPGLYLLIKSFEKTEKKRFCPQCGGEIDPRIMFCFKCKKKVLNN